MVDECTVLSGETHVRINVSNKCELWHTFDLILFRGFLLCSSAVIKQGIGILLARPFHIWADQISWALWWSVQIMFGICQASVLCKHYLIGNSLKYWKKHAFLESERVFQILTLPLISYKSLRKLLHFSEFVFLIYKTGIIIIIYCRVSWGLNELVNIKELVHSRCSLFYFLHFFSHCVLDNWRKYLFLLFLI